MAGQQLMCVWQAVYATDTAVKGNADKFYDVLRAVTSSFSANPAVKFSSREFDSFFVVKRASFDKYVQYTREYLIPPAENYTAVVDAIEDMCWDMCRKFYNLKDYAVDEEDARRIWEVYSRICEPDTMPPNMDQEDASWIGEKFSAYLGQHWTSAHVPHNMCYGELMEVLSDKCFNKASPASIKKAVDELHSWLVSEVSMTGWLQKRTKKQSNWTSWLKRWFVLKPGELTYYDSPRMEKKRGEVVINLHTKLEEMPDAKSLAKRYPARLKVTNSPYLQLELSASDEHEKKAWYDALDEIISAAEKGTTPVQAVLRERTTMKKKGQKASIRAASESFRSMSIRASPTKGPKLTQEGRKGSDGSIPQIMPISAEDPNVQAQINKIQDVFRQVDADNNGAIDKQEFRTFIRGMGLNMSEKEINETFAAIETSDDGIITLDEFSKYFMNSVLDDGTAASGDADSRLQAAFLAADRDGTGTVDFREFTEYLWERKASVRMSEVLQAFNAMSTDGKAAVSLDQFKAFFGSRDNALASILEEDEDKAKAKQNLQGRLKSMYDKADAERIAAFLRERWDSFASFRRTGQSGELVMQGGHGMVADVLPGEYNLVDLACFNDLPPITPSFVSVRAIWIHGKPGSHGRVIFPPTFDGKLPVEIATNEHLRYYGASFADSTQVQVSLMYRHGIQDFTYENQYLEDYVKQANGGAGIERHDFSHLDCPLENNSGYFIFGKLDGDELRLTAFKVPTRHTIYIPGGVIHSNDYLKGTWRTMLSDETDIDHVHLMRQRRKNDNSNLDHIAFDFATA